MSMTHENVLKAFDGSLSTQPVRATVRLKGRKWIAYIGMGEIRLPSVKARDFEQIEKECRCRIRRNGSVFIVIPDVVSEILEKDGVLNSACDEHRAKLREWFSNYGVCVLRYLVGLE